jgi:hypothetical protein
MEIGAENADLLLWANSGLTNAERLRITMNGNIGIGSASPGQLLDVQGTVRVLGGGIITIPSLKATTGTRYLCIDTVGNVTSSATACSGT